MVRPVVPGQPGRRQRRSRSSASSSTPRRRARPIPTTCAAARARRGASSAGRRSSTSATAQVRPNKRIDTKISTPLFHLPLGRDRQRRPARPSLPQRNLLRHLTWSHAVRAGHRARDAAVRRSPPATFSELAQFGVGLERSTPLWYYVLKEAESLGDGLQLGPVGASIVGEVFIGLLQLDPDSYLSSQPRWRPTLPSRTPGDFKMTDFLTFARVDPASRGQ